MAKFGFKFGRNNKENTSLIKGDSKSNEGSEKIVNIQQRIENKKEATDVQKAIDISINASAKDVVRILRKNPLSESATKAAIMIGQENDRKNALKTPFEDKKPASLKNETVNQTMDNVEFGDFGDFNNLDNWSDSDEDFKEAANG